MNTISGSLSSLPAKIQLLSPLTSCLASILNGNISLAKSSKREESKSGKIKLNEFRICGSNWNNIRPKNKMVDLLVDEVLVYKREPLPWVVSHKSDWSFKDNKYCQSRRPMGRTKRLFSRCIASIPGGHYYCPNRSFGLKNDKTISENEKIKEYLSEDSVNSEERDRIKIAFAEGHMAAETKARNSSKLKIFLVLMGNVLAFAILFYIMGSKGSLRSIWNGGSNEVHPYAPDVTFNDVKGLEEAKQELQEIFEFLKDPERFSILGAKQPKGVLLVGPPGTGKTLLARAVAGESGVPFFHVAVSELEDDFAGQGARRMRDLFSKAKLEAPSVVFIDEIDFVGAKRSNGRVRPYASQLLTEMDGFRHNEGVIVLGATNRRENLDCALLRPGRFDVEVQVPVPNIIGRKEILEFYLSKVKHSDDLDIDVLTRRTQGLTGAHIKNIVNQAAFRAAIDGQTSVSMKYLEDSRDRVVMGAERKSLFSDKKSKIMSAYHEVGHVLVAHYTKDSHPLHKVTIVPLGHALGHMAYLPDKEHMHKSKSQMLAEMDVLMGGRATEELIFGTENITTGVNNDLKNATNLATRMVKDYGMSEKIGVRTQPLGNDIESEIRKMLQDSYERAKAILKTHSRELRLLVEALLKYETLNAEEIKSILRETEPPPLAPTPSATLTPSTLPMAPTQTPPSAPTPTLPTAPTQTPPSAPTQTPPSAPTPTLPTAPTQTPPSAPTPTLPSAPTPTPTPPSAPTPTPPTAPTPTPPPSSVSGLSPPKAEAVQSV